MTSFRCICFMGFWLTNYSAAVVAQTIHVQIGRQTIVGKPVSWSDDVVNVFERDGKISRFDPNRAKNYKVVSKNFALYSASELKGRLQKEFGKQFDVSGTGQYLVVHPAGQRDLWAERFERLYRSMVQYYDVRSIRTRRASLPFVAVVFPSKGMYLKYARSVLDFDAKHALGFYSQDTNRIYLYDITAGQPNAQWYLNAETIIHEAAHQTAFNIGIHRRYAYAPGWIVEGVGTLFEARGVWNGEKYRDLNDRVNRMQLESFRKHFNKQNTVEYVKNLIVSDKLFERSSEKAYAMAWMMTFYATETRPKQYGSIVTRTYRRKAFHPYTAGERMRDFRNSFGEVERFAAQMLQYLDANL